MKKFFVLLILLLMAGGAVFYLGWVQMEIPPNTVGVVFSKTWGWELAPLEPGKFSWRWEKLLPRNMSLYLFPLETYSAELSLSGHLPSGELYSLFLEGQPDFRYQLGIQVSYRFKADHLPLLASQDGLLPETLADFAKGLEVGMAESAREILQDFFSSPSANLSHFSTEIIKKKILERYGFLELLSLNLSERVLPDPDLYEKGREMYFSVLDARKKAVADSSRDMAVEDLRDERELERLKKYGEVLTRYPSLIDFLALEKIGLQELSDLDKLPRRTAGKD